MQVRAATEADGERLRTVAVASLEASYSLSPATIEAAVATWYDDEALAEKLADPTVHILVVEHDGEVAGFSESVVIDSHGDVLWLHVAPEHRRHGIGGTLYDATSEALMEAGAETVHGKVLEDNEEGNDFYANHGLTKVGRGEVDINGETHVENIYVAEEPTELEVVSFDDETYYVDHEDADRGSIAPFLTVYVDQERERRYGLYCSNCGSLVTAMDSMGRLECGECGNRRKPTRWDAAYL
jgi:ribosomal protein S18 acetylase RimI-like enzyme/ribosomal protein S27AE